MKVATFFDAPRGENEPDIVGILKINNRDRLSEFAERIGGARIIHRCDEHDLHTKDLVDLTPENRVYLRFEDDGSLVLIQSHYDASSLADGRLTWRASLERARLNGWI